MLYKLWWTKYQLIYPEDVCPPITLARDELITKAPPQTNPLTNGNEVSEDFNLVNVVDEFLETSDLTDPRELAISISSTIPTNKLRGALEETLTYLVRSRISLRRVDNSILNVPPTATEPKEKQPFIKSTKVSAYQQWSAALRDRVHVGGRVWKFLGDCTQDDIKFAAEERDNKAVALKGSANRLWALLTTMETYGASKVGDLPEPAQPKENLDLALV